MNNKTDKLSEKDRFLQTISHDGKNGLVDVKFFRNSNGADSSEEVYTEINEMWSSKNMKSSSEVL